MKIRSVAIAFAALCAASVPAAVFAYTLPAGYTAIEYIQSAGGSVNSAYVDTGYTPTSGSFGFFLDFTYLGTVGTSGTRLMGSSAVAGGKWLGLGLTAWSNSGGGGQLVFDQANGVLDPGIVSGTRTWIELKNRHVTSSTGLNADFSSYTPSYYGNVYVGNAHRATMANGSAMRIYRFKLYNGNTLVHDFVPVTNASGVPGLYDIAGDAGFRASATSIAFTAGPLSENCDGEEFETDVVLPSGYARLDCLEATGTQYIDTGITPTPATAFETVFACTSEKWGRNLNGSVSGDGLGGGNNPLCAGSYSVSANLSAFFSVNGRVGAEVPYDTHFHKYYVGSAFQTIDSTTNTPATPVTAFPSGYSQLTLNVFRGNCWWTEDHQLLQKLKYFKVLESGAVVARMVPALRISDYELGLYDVARQQFLTNCGTGKFVAKLPKLPPGKDDLDPEDTSFAGLKIAVLGDSYSDYRSNGSGYYPALGVDTVDKMWYSIVADTLGATIVGSREFNYIGYIEGVGGTTVGYMTKETSFHSRIWNMGKGKTQGADADIIFVFGGANDQAQGAAQGDYLYDPADWNNTTLKDFRPALASLLTRLRSFYPKARVYCVVNAPATSETDIYLQPEFIESTTNICRHLGVPYIELHDIERENRHPTAAGQRAIGEQVADFVANDFTNRARTVYSDALLWSNDASLERRQIGHEFVYIVTNASKKVRLLFHHPATITEILLVGGGGGGGETIGGGGGGGQVRSVSGPIEVERWSKLVVDVGGGGGGSAVAACERSSDPVVVGNYWHYGFSGTESTLICDGEELYSAAGGGGGGGWGTSYHDGRPGASGGGGSNGGAGGTATDGYAGGSSTSPGAGGG
ncbi:MAG: hypothetical protein IJG70_06715, partial [Kiritimatiellae bacterium]|nr:hypothetical protein [Kiritimatiellia bacterium]